jgi:hypothetical protein
VLAESRAWRSKEHKKKGPADPWSGFLRGFLTQYNSGSACVGELMGERCQRTRSIRCEAGCSAPFKTYFHVIVG